MPPLRRALLWLGIALSLVGLMYVTMRLTFPVRYRTQVLEAAHSSGLDPRMLLAVMKVESNFNPKAASHKGAVGLMQILPSTGRWLWPKAFGKRGPAYSEKALYLPATNIALGAFYLRQLDRRFGGNQLLALAAYNGGSTNVDRWIRGHTWRGGLNFLGVIGFPETRSFVLKVTVSYRIYTFLYSKGL